MSGQGGGRGGRVNAISSCRQSSNESEIVDDVRRHKKSDNAGRMWRAPVATVHTTDRRQYGK